MLDAAVDALAGEDPAAMRSGVVADQVVDLTRLIDRLQVEWWRRVGELDTRDHHRVDGAVSTAAWIRWRCRTTVAKARLAVATARALRAMPLTAAAGARGEVTAAHIEVLAAARDRHPDAFATAEETLVDAAGSHTVAELRRLVAYWDQNLDPDQAAADAAAVYEQRRLYLSNSTDGAFLDGFLDPVGAATVAAALNAHTQPGDRDQADTRTPAQRRADALVEVCRQVLDAGTLPSVNGEKPHVTAIIDLPTLLGQPGSRSELTDIAAVISPETARRLCCDALIYPILTNDGTIPIDMGRATRTVTAAQRRAIAVRDRGCRFPGCHRPLSWCDIHHIVHWANLGPTDLDNLLPLCRYHHTLLHEHGFAITGTATQPRFHRPDGTVLDSRSPP